MKKYTAFILVLLLFPAVALFAQDTSGSNGDSGSALAIGPKATWDQTTFKMGEVEYKVPKEAEFTLTNSGNEPLLITYARSSCGCTVLEYSEEPILPGKSLKIKVTYDATEMGKFRKMISIMTNADDRPTALQIVGEVVKE